MIEPSRNKYNTYTSNQLPYYYTLTHYTLDMTIPCSKSTSAQSNEALDVVIINALLVDPITGIVKADVGIKGNRIVGIEKAGNPEMMDGVNCAALEDNNTMIVGATTDVIAGERLIVTAGGID
mmetsp:Transcript_35065/g.40320  ORF Transcript_35065/g.40320 Transcript_35065/m.40320 type:complete len:123 (-) Transcript_35065:20-388(-)